jgi:carbon-monoxide dehydrogenase large subunit
MNATGIGASVRRKEDQRFITGKGHCTHDIIGSHAHGQGQETTLAQLVSDHLGIPDQVLIVHGDTDKVQFGIGAYGSRSGAVGMSAIAKALDKVEAKAKKVAAHLMEAAEADIEFKDGKFTVAGTDKSLAFGEVALGADVGHKFPTGEIEPGLKEAAFYDPTMRSASNR